MINKVSDIETEGSQQHKQERYRCPSPCFALNPGYSSTIEITRNPGYCFAAQRSLIDFLDNPDLVLWARNQDNPVGRDAFAFPLAQLLLWLA